MQRIAFVTPVPCLLLALCACSPESNSSRPGGVEQASDAAAPADAGAAPTLRQLATPLARLVGVALRPERLSDERYAAAAREFNYATHENELKWNAVEPEPGVFAFDAADRTLEFAEVNGMKMKGHTLVWHSQLANWVKQLTTREEVLAAMERHITTVVEHYRGRIHAWDVVNEAFTGDPPRLRGSAPNDVDDPANSGNDGPDSIFRRLIGEDYIDRAFTLANQADPDARLFYNDFSAEGQGAKSDAIYELVRGMVERGVPIHGVGLQMHVSKDPGVDRAPEAIAANMQRIADLGLELHITEFDVALCGDGAIETRRQEQRARVEAITQVCVAQPRCTAMTLWGVADPDSWRDRDCTQSGGGRSEPLLFDAQYQRKDVYYGVFNPLQAAVGAP